MSQPSSRAHSLNTPKDTPQKSNYRSKRTPPQAAVGHSSAHKTLEQFYQGPGVKDGPGRGSINNLFSPVLSNMHNMNKSSGVFSKPGRDSEPNMQ